MTTPVCHASCLSNKLSINITSLCLLGSGVHFLSSAATHSLSFSFVLSASIPEASVSTNERLYSFCLHLVARWNIGIRSVAYGFHLFISDGDQTRVCVWVRFSVFIFQQQLRLQSKQRIRARLAQPDKRKWAIESGVCLHCTAQCTSLRACSRAHTQELVHFIDIDAVHAMNLLRETIYDYSIAIFHMMIWLCVVVE